MNGMQSDGSSGDLMQQDPPADSLNKPGETVAAGMTFPSSVASGYKAVQPYLYLAPFGGPPQNVWPSQAATSSSDAPTTSAPADKATSSAPPQQTLNASSYNDVTSTGLTPLPSSLNMGTPSADAGGVSGANFNSNNMSAWLNGPGLFDW